MEGYVPWEGKIILEGEAENSYLTVTLKKSIWGFNWGETDERQILE